MGIRGTRKKFYKNISASEEERSMLKTLIEKGSKVSVRIVADDTETDVATLV